MTSKQSWKMFVFTRIKHFKSVHQTQSKSACIFNRFFSFGAFLTYQDQIVNETQQPPHLAKLCTNTNSFMFFCFLVKQHYLTTKYILLLPTSSNFLLDSKIKNKKIVRGMYLNHFLITFDGSPCYSPPIFYLYFFFFLVKYPIFNLIIIDGKRILL